MKSAQWMVWQLADSAFPSGGFAHSGGLEAAWRAGHVADPPALEAYLQNQLCQWANATAPLALWAHRQGGAILEADALCDLVLNHPIANRASRAQGRGLLSAARQIFQAGEIVEMNRQLTDAASPMHMAPVFGGVCRCLEISEEETANLYLFVNLRGGVSAAVRLGIIGPLAAGAMQARLAQKAIEFAQAAARIAPDDVAQTSPVADLLQACHDRLYSRLFQT
jgi:urease accessory protein